MFIMVVEVITMELWEDVSLELLYVDDLIWCQAEESLHEKIVARKSGTELKRYQDEYRENESNVQLFHNRHVTG